MRISSWFGRSAEGRHVGHVLWPLLLTPLIPLVHGVAYTPVQVPDLNLDQLGRVALTGDFDSISLYTYREQNENSFSNNGSQSLISQLPNGDFANVAKADGYIKSLCAFVLQDGTLAGVVVGGNFTSLGGIQAQGIALFDPKSGKITPLPGLTGQVNAVYCDKDTSSVFVGGAFKGGNSTNAIVWVGTSGWANMPFQGFNGPVYSIVKSTNNSVIFGGSFTGLGNTTTPIKKNAQVINISSANISTSANSSLSGVGDPHNVICKTSGQDGPGNTWLLPDNAPGYWKADMNFGYVPTLLRIYNTHYQGRGIKTWRYTAFPIAGIMNFTYQDPVSKETKFCDARCPLSNDPSIPYQDFTFYNKVGMNSFQIDVSEWWGAGAGFNGIELFQDDIFAYAESDLNEPQCVNTSTPSDSSVTGPWKVTPSQQSYSRYLSADLTGANTQVQSTTNVVLRPDIKQKASYSVLLYTPGCIQDNTCSQRGTVNVTGVYSNSAGSQPPAPLSIAQTNNYDKYDEIYRGPVDITTDNFRPAVTIAALSGNQGKAMIVAQRVQFVLAMNSSSSSSSDGGNSSSGGGSLNGLYEFKPNMNWTMDDYSNSAIDSAGADLDNDATVNSIAVSGDTTYVGGNFTDNSKGLANIFSIGQGNATALPNGGLNAQVSSIFAYGDFLYIGGNFSNTVKNSVTGLSNVAAFNTKTQSWTALGAGLNGPVNTIVSFDVNVTANQPELVISFNGAFTQIAAFGSNKAASVQGFAVWVPSRQNWLQNLATSSQAVNGQLSAMTNVTGLPALLAGALSSQDLNADNAVYLTSRPLRVNSVDAGITSQSTGSASRKRSLAQQNVTGVVTGLFHASTGQGAINVTVLGGHFSGVGSNGTKYNNLAFVDQNAKVTGLTAGVSTDSTFLSLAASGNTLFAGGRVTGSVRGNAVNGLVLYDMGGGDYNSTQPPALQGSDVVVNAITVNPKQQQQVFVAGNFDQAGSLSCPSVCYYENGVWNTPGSGISGVASAMTWQGNNKLLVGGNLTIQNNATMLANFDVAQTKWTSLNTGSSIPGPVTALAPADNDATTFWVAGKAANGSAFIIKYDGSNFSPIGSGLDTGSIVQGISLLNTNKGHSSGTNLISSGTILLVTGQLNLSGFGNASAALYNGTVFTPFILATSGNSPGSLSGLFSEKQVHFASSGGRLAVGFIVLIALACALGATFLLVIIGIIIERYRRKSEGYSPAPTRYFDKTSNMGRIPPEQLFGRLAQNKQPPQI